MPLENADAVTRPVIASTRRTAVRTRWIAAAVLLFGADLVLHLPITDLCDAIVKRVGWVAWDTTLRQACPLAGLAMLSLVAAWPAPSRALRAAAFAVLLTSAAVAQQVLLVAGVENIHYPQYALLVCLLRCGGLGMESAWALGTIFGAADEFYQFAALPRGTPAYFDWNDFVLNALGAAFGVVLAATFLRRSPSEIAHRENTSVLEANPAPVVAAGVILAVLVSPPSTGPFFTLTPGGRGFHKLSPAEAVVIVGLLWSGVRRFAGSLSRGR